NADGENEAVWRWMDKNGAKFGLRRPMPGYDPDHIQSGGDWHQVAQTLRASRTHIAVAATDTRRAETRTAKRRHAMSRRRPSPRRHALDDELARCRLALAHRDDLHVGGRIAPRLRVLEARKLADHDAGLGRLALGAEHAAAAREIVSAERLDRRLGMRRVVAL